MQRNNICFSEQFFQALYGSGIAQRELDFRIIKNHFHAQAFGEHT